MNCEESLIHNISVNMFYSHSKEQAARKGTVLFFHGLFSSKDANQKEFESLTSQGFLVVAPDNYGHGNRRSEEFEHKISSKDPQVFEETFIDAVFKTAREIPEIIDELLDRKISYTGKIGITGISMGGFITYGAVSQETRIKAAVPILGCPEWTHPNSPHHFPDRFFPVALLAQNATLDSSVPPGQARNFYKILKPYYSKSPERLEYVEFPESGHIMLGHEWDALWNNTVNWFLRFLS